MNTRTQSTKVVFIRPFILDGMEAMQPPGTYTIDTEEEELGTMRTQGWRRIRTVMRIERAGTTEFLTIDPEQLNKALTRDGVQQDPALPLSPAGPKARRDRARAMGLWPSART